MEEQITAKDPKKVEQGHNLAKISIKAKQDKARKKFMEEEDEELKNHFLSKAEQKLREKFKQENFSYAPYILYPLAGISTLAFFAMLFRGPRTVIEYREHTPEKQVKQKTPDKPKHDLKSNFETLG